MFLFCFQYTLMTKHCRWKPVGKKTEFSMKSRSLSPCYYTKGALTHHPLRGRWYPSLRSGTCALRGNCASCGKRQAAAFVRVLRHTHFDGTSLLGSIGHRALCCCPRKCCSEAEAGTARKKQNNGGDGAWQFTTWNRRSSAGEWDAPLWRHLPT